MWSRSYGIWIYNYLCNQCLSPQKSRVGTSFLQSVLDTTLCDKVSQWLATGRWFSQGTPVSSTNKTDRHDIAEILLKVALTAIKQTKPKLNSSRKIYVLRKVITNVASIAKPQIQISMKIDTKMYQRKNTTINYNSSLTCRTLSKKILAIIFRPWAFIITCRPLTFQ